MRGAADQWREQSHREAASLVVGRDRKAKAWLDGGSSQSTSGSDVRSSFRKHGAAELSSRRGQVLCAVQTHSHARGLGGFLVAELLRTAAAAIVGHRGSGAANRLRESGKSNAGPREYTGARDGG